MTDIEFDQIREGQTVRVHHRGGFLIEGPVISTGGYLGIGSEGGCCHCSREAVARVELLSEPAPKWEVGQLAEVTWRVECGTPVPGRHMAVRRGKPRHDDGWYLIDSGHLVADAEVVGEPRLLKAVPADAILLRPCNPYGNEWDDKPLKRAAQAALDAGLFFACDVLTVVRTAIEEAQR